MHEITRLLELLADGDAVAAERLTELDYTELRQMPARRISHSSADQTLNRPALVHEAWLRRWCRRMPEADCYTVLPCFKRCEHCQ